MDVLNYLGLGDMNNGKYFKNRRIQVIKPKGLSRIDLAGTPHL